MLKQILDNFATDWTILLSLEIENKNTVEYNWILMVTAWNEIK